MRTILLFLMLSGIIVSVNSCYYDKEELLYSGLNSGSCTDSSGVISYSQKVMPLLQQYCYNCHLASFPSGGIVMGTYAADRVVALNGKLFGTINHSPGFSPMPQGMPRMSSCQVATIKKWIDTGILNN